VNLFQYVFDGLGHLISKILITSIQYTNQLDEPGVQKICRNILSLQQTLASVTMSREVGLDHARHYFELFYMTPEVKIVHIISLCFNHYVLLGGTGDCDGKGASVPRTRVHQRFATAAPKPG
jgi:hypothetical protein